MKERQRIVILGLTITSSWGNGHATTYRALVRALVKRGHRVLFLERDMPWYASNRDLPHPPFGRTALYQTVQELRNRFGREISDADLVIVGSYVPDGIEVGQWVCSSAKGVTAFYDIDTPVTLAALAAGTCTYLSKAQVPRYDLYLSCVSSGSTGLEWRVRCIARSIRPRITRDDANHGGISATWGHTVPLASRRSSDSF
jgi:spore maturation protein CgeB